MKNKTLYNKTVDILVQSYFNDTLVHGQCHACAVGNLVNYYMPFTQEQIDDLNADQHERSGWSKVFCTYNSGYNGGYQKIDMDSYFGINKEQIDCTGYSVTELAKIENAFETADTGSNEDEYMFNGLMAVIDVLDIIHENTDIQATEQTKKRFVRQSANTRKIITPL